MVDFGVEFTSASVPYKSKECGLFCRFASSSAMRMAVSWAQQATAGSVFKALRPVSGTCGALQA